MGVTPQVWIGKGVTKKTRLIVLHEKPRGTGEGKGEMG